MTTKEILIVGAGPSGLSMALFLNELGYHPRIIDKKSKISPYSKALAVNPRTLDIFEPFGLTQKFLKVGRKMEALNIWKANQHIFKNELNRVNHRYPFMLVLPQKQSEEILLEAVQERNIKVEYQTDFTSFEECKDGTFAVRLNGESSKFDYLIGADGGRSLVRDQAGIQMDGYRYDEEWELYDIELQTDLPPDEGHIRVFPEGGMIMIRLKENIWRLAGNMEGILDYLPKGTKIGKVHWESTFRIHHKVAKELTKGNIVLIGDAAHLHSPVGARGMNLGIEDAFLASQLLHENRLHEYTKQRQRYLRQTVNRINNITMGVAGDQALPRFFRRNVNWISTIFPVVMPQVRKFVMGLN